MSSVKRTIPFVVATAGHVDHGKSALVHTLTQVDPDRLPEEKRRGITIDLGFAQWRLTDPENPALEFDLGMVDVPGHEDFVKNMVSGVGAVDLGLLIVAADDGWMPQTEEHFQILEYLAVPHLIVVMTKLDLAEGEADFVMEMIREELKDTRFEASPIVGTSTKTGEGFDRLGQEVAAILRDQAPHLDSGKPRLPVDRAFSVKGLGTIVTGTLMGAPLELDQSVCVQPGNIQTKVRSIQHHHAQQSSVQPGMRTALNLAGVGLRKGHDPMTSGIGRGQVMTLSHLGRSTQCLDGIVTRSERLNRSGKQITSPLKSGTRIRLHIGSDNIPGRIDFPEHAPLTAGETAPARIRLDRPFFGVEGDRFVLRDWSQQGTIGGGRIWDVHGDRIRFGDPAQQQYLRQLMESTGTAGDYLEARVRRDHGLHLESFCHLGQWTLKQLSREAARLVKEKTAIKRSDWLLDGDWWRQSLEAMVERICAYHRSHPDHPGYPLEAGRREFGQQLPSMDLWSALLAELSRDHGIDQAGECLCHQSHSVALPDRLQGLAEEVLKTLGKTPNEPPARKHLETSQDAGDTIRCLIRMKQIVEVGSDLLILSDAYEGLLQSTRGYIAQHGPSTVSALRQNLGVSRRIAIPLLEKLDRDGFTQREGDLRSWKGD